MDSTSVVSKYLYTTDRDTNYTLVATPCVLKQIRYQSRATASDQDEDSDTLELYDGTILLGKLFQGEDPGFFNAGNIVNFPGLGIRFNTSVVIKSVGSVSDSCRNITCIYQGPPGTAPT